MQDGTGFGAARSGAVGTSVAGQSTPDAAVTMRLEPATREDIELAASGGVAHVIAPAVGGDLWDVDELRLAFLLDDSWRGLGVHVRRSSPTMLALRVGGEAVSQADVDRAVSQVRRILSLDCGAAEFAAVAGRDAVLDGIRREAPGIRPILFGSPYEAACWAIVCQGLRTDQAVALYSRVLARYGRMVPVAGRRRLVPGPPAELRAVSPATRLSARKRDRLAIIADAARSGLLDAAALRAMEPGDALHLVRQLPGIGPLSAELIVARGAGHPDVFPAHDRTLLAAMHQLYDRPPVEVAERWRPWRSWASFVIRCAAVQRGIRGGASP